MDRQTCHCSLGFVGEEPDEALVPSHLVQSFDRRDGCHIKNRGDCSVLSAADEVIVGDAEIVGCCSAQSARQPISN